MIGLNWNEFAFLMRICFSNFATIGMSGNGLFFFFPRVLFMDTVDL